MHIVQIYKDYHPVLGGIENHVRDLSEGLTARGHRVTVLVTNTSSQTEIEYPRKGLTVIKAARTLHLSSTPLSIAMLFWSRRLHPDVVHLHFPYPPGDLIYHALPQHVPLIVTYHSDIVRQRTLLHIYRPLLHWTLSRATYIIATSPNYMASSPFLQRHSAKCKTIPLGIDTTRFTHADEQQVAERRARYQRPLLLFVGRLRYYKGLHILIEAMPHVDADLLIAGSGPELDRLGQQAETLGIAAHVHFLGDIPDSELPALYHAADVFVLPAHLRSEALGIAQIEALASGVPCVSTELGTGTSYANLHNKTGLVVPSGDSIALAQAINELLSNAALRRRFGAAGQQRANTLFSRDRMLHDIDGLYSGLALPHLN
ncbi:MAG: glycosyltransferase [Chloroflexi bacterium AL-W]|nr:glycosyltransferase [Chloroflexi bacterium AL-N1]NOK66234.1 glycosyltransferase [Chloroflexi bacterium AL-N10]NOK73115.1 glycosyltransferase [Chloroflexi bacterium AL-N5]NOK80012.1 glycosyltransferase [Chloroflexi bacterium AL-W]NOK88132.1 glycosyltransferase [Chloroflexi bacterium AL-N15]